MRKALLLIALTFALAGAGLYAYLLFTGPRMYDQPSLQPFNAAVPPPPKGAVPLNPPPAAGQTPATVEPTAANLERGRTYYAYYCLACHGPSGAGDGPVGQSYTPVPADLRSPRLGTLSDSDYLRASLAGVGHSPVLERVVGREHRPYLLVYCRSLVVGPAATRPRLP